MKVINVLIRTDSKDPRILKTEIESSGFNFISSFANKITARGRVKDLPALADLDFIEYIETSN